MDIKIKRRNLRLIILLSGVFLPVLLLPWADPKIGGPLTPVSYCLCVVAIRASEFMYGLTRMGLLSRITFIITHVSFYLALGVVIANLKYPISKSEKLSEPTQD